MNNKADNFDCIKRWNYDYKNTKHMIKRIFSMILLIRCNVINLNLNYMCPPIHEIRYLFIAETVW